MSYDVVVVGGGNAGFCAALAAAGRGRRVLLLEKGLPDEAGGNSYYTAGAFRVAHGGLPDLAGIVDHDDRHAETVLPPYPPEDFVRDLERVTEGRTDPELAATVAGESRSALGWLRTLGLRFRLMYERQSYQDADGRHVFWGGLAVGSTGGGKGLIAQHTAAAAEAGIEVRYGHRAERLLTEDGRVTGVAHADGEIRAESVVLAAGGFEADPEWRRAHLGDGWERARVRGTPLNTGDMLRAALAAGAARGGDWSSCHSVAWDAGAPATGDRTLTNRLTRQSYPLGIVVNRDGRRFLDEGADFRNYTYARYGGEILRQPGGVAFQVFDAEIRPLLRTEEYDAPGASVVVADTLDALARGMGVPADTLTATVTGFNDSIDETVRFDPSIKDGRAARTTPPKSNWALPIRTAPFYAFAVTCGITFTFGGLRADPHGRVLTGGGTPLPGLFVCGEMLGGLFSGNYPGGSGLTAGAVIGRRAGLLA
ncbi:FAD-dependent tricarballylate dehydrogenase TcuA [Catenuloplanes atrovinosus]|uniref:Tricarballylate dehydrogenase n=1 Tax=Catenuloplanes atrovinosus TaxID=137266 RepID=A0AAE3YSG5_9ACTN|nr:FAD-dependent tricarballylate dehydrogenase TcuA [Catenuloplanes atrovinosus]MDR7277801.1 tricarballylate dehydrogenase [Catenuloplanes atrovinosus]